MFSVPSGLIVDESKQGWVMQTQGGVGGVRVWVKSLEAAAQSVSRNQEPVLQHANPILSSVYLYH